uniref:Uncharacterized protein n=1 Tax=viral metagenome TaxID=1070528 RepID=A0A6C0IX92_9ZZZZ
MKYLYIFFIFLILYYIFNYNNESYSNYHTKNRDLDYIKKRLKIPNKKSQKIPVSPISLKKTKKIRAVDGYKDSTRIPDDNSDLSSYVLNQPNIDDIIDSPIDLTKFKKKNPKLKKVKKSKVNKSTTNKHKVRETKVKKSELNSCMFVSSINNEAVVCPKNYSLYTGAKIGSTDGNLECNSEKPKTIKSKAKVKVKKGKIEIITITNPGMNYYDIPGIKILGEGKGAKAIARIKDKKVNEIIIANKGSGYTKDTQVIIEKPKITMFCNLCCKK